MASLVKEKNGSRRIEFVDENKRRKRIRLGKIPLRDCRTIKNYVERIVAAKIGGDAIESEVARWLAKRPDWLHNRMASSGLVDRRETAVLNDFIQSYVDGRTDLKPLTLIKFNATKTYLVEFFGSDSIMRDIRPGDVDDFRRFLAGPKKIRNRKDKLVTVSGMAENTIRKHMQISKQIFEAAKRKRLIEENPFDGQRITVRSNPDRFYFVTKEDTKKILEACPDAEWRLIVALSRYGGLRCPSEHHELTWDDIDWENKRVTIRSPKTEHHEGKAVRVIPMFPELEVALNDVWDCPESEGTTYVINRHRGANLRSQFSRIVKRAQVTEWQKPFHNMRSTRETELANEYPIHVVCKWIGNSATVAMKHYLQMTDEHFDRATGKAARNAAQSVLNRGEFEGNQEPQETNKAPQ